MRKILETERLKLIACDKELLQVAIEGNDKLATYLGATVPANWTEFGERALEYALRKLEHDESEKNWWTYFPILKEENALIGTGGYKGKPTAEGIIEIGYEISKDYRNKGLATEFTHALVLNAFSNDTVKLVIAHTLGEINGSTKVLAKCNFVKAEEINDPSYGSIWKWELKRQADAAKS
jgi:RimJ/RimL family protein N-acetyltransferase